jgi:hypothetical protein
MDTVSLNSYIENNYQKFLDHANFQADKYGYTGMGEEILQFVFEIVLVDMDREKVMNLLASKYGDYNELHAYIMGMIKINAYSPRSDFRRKIIDRKYIDDNVDFRRLRIVDEIYDPDILDRADEIFSQFEIVRNELAALDISDFEKEVFKWRFFYDNNISEWPGPEPKSKLYVTYNRVLDILKERIAAKQLKKVS